MYYGAAMSLNIWFYESIANLILSWLYIVTGVGHPFKIRRWFQGEGWAGGGRGVWRVVGVVVGMRGWSKTVDFGGRVGRDGLG